jgi:guanine nucleotide-binding protein subunit beta-2-like 1 protein
MMLCIFH